MYCLDQGGWHVEKGPNSGYVNSESNYALKKEDFIYLFLERREGREKERERNINVWLPLDLACNPGMFPDQELNL